jgi:hypothetical protein
MLVERPLMRVTIMVDEVVYDERSVVSVIALVGGTDDTGVPPGVAVEAVVVVGVLLVAPPGCCSLVVVTPHAASIRTRATGTIRPARRNEGK